MSDPLPLHRSTPAELKARLEAERRGAPFLLFHDGAGCQVIHELTGPGDVSIGRGAGCDVELGWDREVSRLHAQLEPAGGQWLLVDDGISRNGSFVNGERVAGGPPASRRASGVWRRGPQRLPPAP